MKLFLRVIMLKAATSWILTLTITLSQAGLPVHMHYCKGILESFGLFGASGCHDHDDHPVTCCNTINETSCQSLDCCSEEVKVLLQEFDSLVPQTDYWLAAPAMPSGFVFPEMNLQHQSDAVFHSVTQADTGPPIYIRFHSLIFYA